MADLQRVDRPGKHPVWVERLPSRCPWGEPLTPGRMRVGWQPCGCDVAIARHRANHGQGHRTVACLTHGVEWLLPPCDMWQGPKPIGFDA